MFSATKSENLKNLLNRSLATAAMLAAMAAPSQAQDRENREEKHFSGLYLGIQGGHINVGTTKGGSIGGLIGWRYQTNNNLVFGAEISVQGAPDADTSLGSYGGTVGFVTGPENTNLFYAGASYAFGPSSFRSSSRGFIANNEGFTLVAGYERALNSWFSFRLQGSYIDLNSVDISEAPNDSVPVFESGSGFSTTAGLILKF